MIELNDSPKATIPKIQSGDFAEIVFCGKHQIVFCYQETSSDGLNLVSLTYSGFVWKDIQTLWIDDTQGYEAISNIRILPPGTEFRIK